MLPQDGGWRIDEPACIAAKTNAAGLPVGPPATHKQGIMYTHLRPIAMTLGLSPFVLCCISLSASPHSVLAAGVPLHAP